MKTLIIAIVVLALAGVGFYFLTQYEAEPVTPPDLTEEPGDITPAEPSDTTPEPTSTDPVPTDTPAVLPSETTVGTSANGTTITAYHYGSGAQNVLLIGGIHGGYSFNTALLGWELVDYFAENPDAVPDDVRVTVIPVLNPDGLAEVTGKTGRFTRADVPSNRTETIPGRFNGNSVDLNRNFDCEWQAQGVWQDQDVSGGSAPFSEPEAAAMRDFIATLNPVAVVTYYSSAGGVYSSSCNNGVSAPTLALTNTYASAAGYEAYESFDFYEITGDMVNWLAKEGYPAISVLLTDHENTEWSKNKAGVDAVLAQYAE